MNHSTFHNHKTSTQKQHKHTTKRLTEDQVRLLELNFDSTKKLEPERKHQLARQLGIPPRQIAIWYQNKRARWKNQSLEHGYAMLQLQLEATLVEARQLQKEVERLRLELNKLQAETRHYKQNNNNNNNNNNDNNNNNHHRPLMDYSVSLRGVEDANNLYCFGEQVFESEEMYAAASMMGSDLGVFGSRKNLL